MDSKSTNPHSGRNCREHVGRCERVEDGSLDVRKPISKQRIESFFNELEQGTVSLTDEELARLKRIIMERRGRAAVHVIVAPIDIAQPSNLRSRCSDITCDVHIYMEENTEGKMKAELGQLKSSSADTGIETPGQQCLLT